MRTVILGFLLVAATESWAALAPRTREQLTAGASVIVVGEIVGHETVRREAQPGWINDYHTLQVRVSAIEQGSIEAAGGTIDVHGYSVVDSGGMPGPGGHFNITGQQPIERVVRSVESNHISARFFLTRENDQYRIIEPNGFEIVSVRPKEQEQRRSNVIVVSAIVVAVGLMGVFISRIMRGRPRSA